MTAHPTGQRGGAAEAVEAILARVIRDLRTDARRRRRGMEGVWARAVGPALAEETHVAALRQGVLTVEVRSASLLHELDGFRKSELLAALLAEEPSGRVRGLRFRLGVF